MTETVKEISHNDSDPSQTQWATDQISREACTWAMFCHLAGLVGFSPILPCIGSLIAPFVIWQLKADEFPFVAEQGRRAVNFQLSMLLYAGIGTFVCLISFIGIPLIPAVFCIVGFVDLILVLMAAARAKRGEHYRYPLTIRFFKNP